MRGVDYKTQDGLGIDLLIARNFPSTSAYQQGLGRVGRYGEPCERFRWTGLTDGMMVDKKEELNIISKIAKVN